MSSGRFSISLPGMVEKLNGFQIVEPVVTSLILLVRSGLHLNCGHSSFLRHVRYQERFAGSLVFECPNFLKYDGLGHRGSPANFSLALLAKSPAYGPLVKRMRGNQPYVRIGRDIQTQRQLQTELRNINWGLSLSSLHRCYSWTI
jgi:hypothetical protein